jgi:hypothetical protein
MSVTAVAPLPMTTTRLPAVVEVLGPVLRVDDLAAEALEAGQLGREALVVAVVAARAEQPAGGHLEGLARVGPLDLDGPQRPLAGPLGAHGPVAEADVAVDAVLLGGLADVGADRVAVGDRLRRRSTA